MRLLFLKYNIQFSINVSMSDKTFACNVQNWQISEFQISINFNWLNSCCFCMNFFYKIILHDTMLYNYFENKRMNVVQQAEFLIIAWFAAWLQEKNIEEMLKNKF